MRSVRVLLISVAALLLAGCFGNKEIGVPPQSVYTPESFQQVCLDGVVYFIRATRAGSKGMMTVKLGRDSKVVYCSDLNPSPLESLITEEP